MTNETSGKQCMVNGCHNIVKANDLCQMHYMRQHRHGDVLQTRAADWGSREKHPLYRCWNGLIRYHRDELCERWSDLWLFVADIGDSRPSPKHFLTRKDAELPYGPENFYWREARVSGHSDDKKAEHRDYMRAWNSLNARKLVERELLKRYGITCDDYEDMLNSQGHVCAICGQPESRVDHRTKKVSRLAVDHCHKSNAVRGLLCHHCNNALGCFDDNADEMASAMVYVAKHSSEPATVLMSAISKLQAALPAAGTA